MSELRKTSYMLIGSSVAFVMKKMALFWCTNIWSSDIYTRSSCAKHLKPGKSGTSEYLFIIFPISSAILSSSTRRV